MDSFRVSLVILKLKIVIMIEIVIKIMIKSKVITPFILTIMAIK
jgi:hypothetical protein